METTRLLVTELIANSVRHTGAPTIAVKARLAASSVRFDVSDDGPGFDRDAAIRRGARDDESGWGLYLVERLANRWGVRREDGCTHVWFELQRQPA